ncbi:MAG: oligosaccharide flippase family protein, partial [Nitrososphaeraceae archaeon]|nr:oligosaccharide flippase family protein [Nitrososphaeraceae archaeon]
LISLKYTLPYLNRTFIISKLWVKRLWHFGKYGFYTNLSNSGLTSTDHFLIGGLVSTASVAIYNASARITNIFIIPSVAIADILYPKSVAAQTEKGTSEVRDLYEKAVGATLVPMIPVMVVISLFPELFIELLAGEKYLEAASILRVAILGILILPFLKQFGTIMNTIDKPHYNFYFVLLLAITNLGSNYIFITKFGIIGAAYGTLTSYFVGFIASQIILKKLIGASIFKVLKNTLYFYRKAIEIVKSKLH